MVNILTGLSQRVSGRLENWRAPLVWGYGVALAHRLVLGIWMALVCLVIGVSTLHLPLDYPPHGDAGLPALSTPLEQVLLGVWRRWDARHYLSLAYNGYSIRDPGSTVFGPLTPLGIHLLDLILPGSVDVAGLFFSTLAFGLALALLYRFCEVYYRDADLGQHAIILTALLPLSYFFSAPMSESIYLAMVLGLFYAGVQGRWGLAGLFGALATLARAQGVVLAAIAVLLLLKRQPTSMSWQQRVVDAVQKAWPLGLIPVSYLGFVAYRSCLGLPSLTDTYHQYAYIFFVNPLEGLFINLRWFSAHLPESLINTDFLAVVATPVFLILLVCHPHHRRLSLVSYSVIFALLFISKVNWKYGTETAIATISLGRYSLTLFPLAVLAADMLRSAPRWGRLTVRVALIFGLLAYSAQHALGIGPA